MDVKNVSVFKQEGSKGELPKTNSISELAMDIYMGPGRKGVSVMTQEEKDDTKWHDFQTAQYAGKILTGIVAGTEMQGEDGVPSERENAPGEEAQFIVDYVKVYQYKDIEE